jgi:hypothetical protein
MLALAPEHPRAGQAEIELDLARSDLEALEPRLSYMLTLPQWFDVSWTLGERDAPAWRYQKAGISPDETQTQKLKDAGFICGPDGAGGPVQGAGDTRDWLDGLTWCNPLPEPVERRQSRKTPGRKDHTKFTIRPCRRTCCTSNNRVIASICLYGASDHDSPQPRRRRIRPCPGRL